MRRLGPYHSIDDPTRLRRLIEAILLLEEDLSLPALLGHFVEEARTMVGARYGALGVLNDDRTGLAELITAGVTETVERAVGHPPEGLGVLGLLISDPRPLRMGNIADHPKRAGFPPGHPPMQSFLGVPVGAHGEVYGNLYLTDKIGWSEFTQEDEALVTALAQAAGIAIENARLHERVQAVAILEDRDRIARDLHDAVIQQLFAVGLSLQGAARPPASAELVERLQQAVADIDDTIRRIRSTIFELTSGQDDLGVRAAVLALVQELQPVVGLNVPVVFEGPVDASIRPDLAEHLLAAVRETLTNVGHHARASKASLRLTVDESTCTLTVIDNGRGIANSSRRRSPSGGLGIGNLRRRAEKRGGELRMGETPGGGTTVVWQVPIEP